ncbi:MULTISPECIES: hypothetical protein [Aerosakkonema]|uniref:hypothetical protein n=1 Tax=Aerosakkonema TaxID=1246629 RepID=UPI0035B7E48B
MTSIKGISSILMSSDGESRLIFILQAGLEWKCTELESAIGQNKNSNTLRSA